jgi:putative transposase
MGALTVSEQALSALLLAQRSWQGWLHVGDRNFGVYSVVRSAEAAHAQGLFRLTEARATKLARLAKIKLGAGLDALISWSASTHDQCPEDLARTPVPGRLVAISIERPGFRTFTLYLFTTLVDQLNWPPDELAKLYAHRWKIELGFRYIKAQMDLGFLECHSADMLRKEWLVGLIAYNLIRWTMAAAAALAQIPVHLLSFSRARELLLGWCWRSSLHPRSLNAWKRLLARISKARLPNRKPRPSEPRAIRLFNKNFAKLEGFRATARRKLAKANANS